MMRRDRLEVRAGLGSVYRVKNHFFGGEKVLAKRSSAEEKIAFLLAGGAGGGESYKKTLRKYFELKNSKRK